MKMTKATLNDAASHARSSRPTSLPAGFASVAKCRTFWQGWMQSSTVWRHDRNRRAALLASVAFGVSLAAAPPAAAQNATRLLNPGSGDFNTAANWSPAAVPTGTASFDASNTTALSFSANTVVDGFTFNTGAPAYTFTIGAGRTLDFTGAGVINNSGNAPTFQNSG